MSYTQEQIVQIITDEAQALGIPVDLALAIARQESGLNPNAVGDGGHSIGLFQLNDQGEGHGMSVAQREDPATNARIALTQVANVMRANPNLSPGQIAAAAQRPADRAGYAQAIDSALGQKLSPEQYADMSPEGIQYRQNVQAGGSGAPGLGESANVDLAGLLQSQAPKLAAELADPQVKNLLNQWANNKLSDAEFQNELEQTNWWKTTPKSQRDQLVAEATDPATATQTISQNTNYVNTLAAQMGVGLPGDTAQSIALHMINDNWTQAQVRQELAKYGKYQGDITYKGEAGVDVQQLKDLYASYALPASDQTLNSQLQLLLAGTQTLDEFKQGVAQKAKSLYGANPDLAAALDRGETVDQAMSSYADLAATLTGTDPGQINWLDPKWNVALTGVNDPKTGQTTGMSMAQWGRALRSDPIYGYDGSENAVSTASQFANQLLAKMTGAS